jgi:hypothetical protein
MAPEGLSFDAIGEVIVAVEVQCSSMYFWTGGVIGPNDLTHMYTT